MQKQILIINNNVGVSYLLAKILKSPKVEIIVKNSYEDVTEIVKKQCFDLILTDALIDGTFMFEYIEELRFNCPNTRIIVMSEMGQQTIKNSLKAMGMDYFVSLPFNPIKIKERVSNYLYL